MNENNEVMTFPKSEGESIKIGSKSFRFGMMAEVVGKFKVKFSDEVTEDKLETLVGIGRPVEPNKNPLADLIYKKIEEKMSPEQKEIYRINSERNVEYSRDVA